MKDLKKLKDNCSYPNEPLNMACIVGNLDFVKQCLNPSSKEDILDIHYDHDVAIKYACHYGHLDVVQYLLNSSEIAEHSDINNFEDNYSFIHDYGSQKMISSSKNLSAFAHACVQGHLNIVQYLLNSTEIKSRPVLNLDKAGINLLKHVAFRGQITILDCLLDFYRQNNYPSIEALPFNPIKKIKNSITQAQWRQTKLKIFDDVYLESSETVKIWIYTQKECMKIQRTLVDKTKPTSNKKAML